MRNSEFRIREALAGVTLIKLRRLVDPLGDTGNFLICTFPNAATAREISEGLRAEGIVTWPQGVTNILMNDWGLHIYYNIASLVHRTSNDRGGFPWNLAENQDSTARYVRGTCPHADQLFDCSLLLAIPSCLSIADESDIIGVRKSDPLSLPLEAAAKVTWFSTRCRAYAFSPQPSPLGLRIHLRS
jgi:hypothetical protein